MTDHSESSPPELPEKAVECPLALTPFERLQALVGRRMLEISGYGNELPVEGSHTDVLGLDALDS